MGGSSIDDEWELTAPEEVRTVVLVGRAGNGKSATGNSILGRKGFISRRKSTGVTSTCQLESALVRDGQHVNVIDTPGLFDFSAGFDVVGKEIVKCIDLAKDGIHAILVVFSVLNRFTKEEADALQSLQTFFGEKISDYMIIVFTGGDELEDNDETLADYMGRECPKPLQEVLKACKNRMVLFDNRTRNEKKKAEQLQQLLSLVNMVMVENGGRPYSHEFFAELKKREVKLRDQEEQVDSLKGQSEQEILEFKKQMYSSYEEQLNRITEMVEDKLKETTQKLQEQLAAEQAARLKAEEQASDEIRHLRESLEKAYRENEEFREKTYRENEFREKAYRENEEFREKAYRENEEFRKQAESGRCAIL